MRVDLFDFDLPADLVAQSPARPRDSARLLEVQGDGTFSDRHVLDLPLLLRPGDLLVFNDTKVLPVRLFGRRGDAAIEVTLIEVEGEGVWQAFARPARRLRPGDTIVFADDFEARVAARDGGEVRLRFEQASFRDKLVRYGAMPLPPYLRRAAGGDRSDLEDYQTMFAREEGAVAAPTAALHFTPELVERLRGRGIGHAFLTLHVGAGTFLPVKVAETSEHRMHEERFVIGDETAGAIERARAAGRRIVAVGTTVLRTLESVAGEDGRVAPTDGSTDLFITPGYRFRVVDLLLTNFHLPRSTLFMLVAAFAGLERMQAAYRHAIAQRYRFYSYGDACLLERSS
jgi:S-adenosylmethionine:tRNA ribosyltransferase-isomerase